MPINPEIDKKRPPRKELTPIDRVYRLWRLGYPLTPEPDDAHLGPEWWRTVWWVLSILIVLSVLLHILL